MIKSRNMNGIELKEFYELISHNREAEFEYKDKTYVLQPEVKDNKAYLVIWDVTPNEEKCIAKQDIPIKGTIPIKEIDAVLLQKCFDGNSFLDIEKDITVTYIY